MKWPTIAEAWMYRDPQEIADSLIGVSARLQRRAAQGVGPAPASLTPHDRYYTRARQLRIQQAMKGRR